MGLNRLIKQIKSGNFIKSSELLPYLCLKNVEERWHANFRLAEAYSEIGDLRQAKVFISRSWILSQFSPDLLPLYVKIHLALNDIGAIRDAYKRLGMVEASKGNISDALKYFNLWQYAFTRYQKLNKYNYDFDILDRIKEMAKPWRYKDYDLPRPSDNRKIRLAYLTFGMVHINSVLIKISRILAQYHDKDRFEVTFFVPEPRLSVYRSPQAEENIKMFRKYGCDAVVAGGFRKGLERLLKVGEKIYNYKPDVLVTSALLAEFGHYFITCLRPAPIIVGLLQGPPPQFTAPCLDWSISWSKHPLIDCPCDCSLVQMGLDLPDTDSITPYKKKDFDIPEDSQILLSAGRHEKFQSVDFWKSVLSILSAFPSLHYVVVGVNREQLPFLDELLPSELEGRVKLLGWRKDQLNIFCLADLVIDTFPSGGGHVLIETMALGIPFVSFENNYMKEFDQTDWSVADEFVSVPELILKRGDFKQFKCTVSKLLEDKAYRSKMGRLCKEQIHSSMGSPEKGLREFEGVLLEIIEKKKNHGKNYFCGNQIIKFPNNLQDKFRKLFSKLKVI